MKRIAFFLSLLLIAAITLVGCGSDNSTPPVHKAVTVQSGHKAQITYLGTGKTTDVQLTIGSEAKDIYLLLSNHSDTDRDTRTYITTDHRRTRQAAAPITMATPVSSPLAQDILRFRKKSSTLLHAAPSGTARSAKALAAVPRHQKSVGDTHTFSLDQSDTGTTTAATLKKIVADVTTRFGNKTLNVWVSDDSFDGGSGCGKSRCVTQSMVDALTDAFLKSGDDNDIYDYDTAIYGEEWGNDAQIKYSNVIGQSDTIDILLTDISGDDNPAHGIIGYFYPKDNYDRSTVSGSNERIMFYIDSVMFANGESGSWSIHDRYPQEILSTLAHEFQHMIHFYQKTLLLAGGQATQTWLDEMLSETTEDIVATRIGIPGPRAVDPTDGSAGSADITLGRYPGFNAAGSRLSLTQWGYTITDYSKVSAFGTFLIRNYGGAKLLHDIQHNPYTDQQAVLDAVHRYPGAKEKTFADLLREWGAAVLLSDRADLPESLPTYNTGDFTPTTYHNTTYEMGSINFFHYTPLPPITDTIRTVESQSNLYYRIGTGITGAREFSIHLDTNTSATLIIKDPS